MRNRDKLQQTCIYDLLLKINRNLFQSILDSDQSIDFCVLDLLKGSEEPRIGCASHRSNCASCISDWLNRRDDIAKKR